MPNGTGGENGRLAIYSSAAPAAFGAVITGTRFDNATAAYPLALTLAGEPPPAIVSFTHRVQGFLGYIATINCTGAPERATSGKRPRISPPGPQTAAL